jgi:hypothetical protein
VPQKALREFCSVPLPDDGFVLVDDYWMCFVLNKYFGRNLRKLQCIKDTHFERTADSEQSGLALFTRPEVRDARTRMYVHHMLRGWPKWSEQLQKMQCPDDVAYRKLNFWQGTNIFFGFNVSSRLYQQDVVDLQRLGIKTVRLGSVGSREADFEFSAFIEKPAEQLQELRAIIELLKTAEINAIITLHRDIASAQLWSLIAAEFFQDSNVVGYDLINEPYTVEESKLHWSELSTASNHELTDYIETIISFIHSIRCFDRHTPVIVEPTFWGSTYALTALSPFINTLKSVDANIVVSVHFYNPSKLTARYQNRNQFGYPDKIPVYDSDSSEVAQWDDHLVGKYVEEVRQWQTDNDVKVFVGEFGIARETPGAADYLRAVGLACRANGLSCLLYSFREDTWDAMNYELGPVKPAVIVRTPIPWDKNCLMAAIREIVSIHQSL